MIYYQSIMCSLKKMFNINYRKEEIKNSRKFYHPVISSVILLVYIHTFVCTYIDTKHIHTYTYIYIHNICTQKQNHIPYTFS